MKREFLSYWQVELRVNKVSGVAYTSILEGRHHCDHIGAICHEGVVSHHRHGTGIPRIQHRICVASHHSTHHPVMVRIVERPHERAINEEVHSDER